VTSFEDFGTLSERGAAWLFLRWLGDREGAGVYRRLVQSRLTGTENVAAVAGRPFPELFAQFGIAVWADSLPGLARDAVPLPYRFTSRTPRALFARLAAVGAVQGGFPVRPASLAGGAALSRDMKAGSLDYFELRVPAESASVLVRFAPGAGDQGFHEAAGAALGVPASQLSDAAPRSTRMRLRVSPPPWRAPPAASSGAFATGSRSSSASRPRAAT
jgi:hypothetical protein